MAKVKGTQTAAAAKKNIDSLSAAFDDGQDFQYDDSDMDAALSALFDDIEVEEIKQGIEEAAASGAEMVDITKLIPNKLNKYHMDEDDETFKAIKASMLKEGFLQGFSIIGEKRDDGNVTIISGHRRTKIAKSLGIKELPITYIECGSDVERLRKSITANMHRRDSIRDTLYNYKELEKFYDNGEFSPEETKLFKTKREFLASLLGIEESTLKNNAFLFHVDERIWTLIDKGIVTISSIRELHSKKQLEVINELAENKSLLDSNVLAEERRNQAKAIIEKKAKTKGRPKGVKKAHAEIVKLCKALTAIKESSDTYTRPKNETEQAVMLSHIEKMEKLLADIKEEISATSN